MTEDSKQSQPEEGAQKEAPPKESAPAKPAKSMAAVLLKGEIKIYPDQRLPYLDQGPVKAYVAEGADRSPAFAMVCEKHLVPQIEVVHKYAGTMTPLLPKLIACGVVNWSLDFKEHFVFVYENKLGDPISKGRNPNALGMKAEFVVTTVLKNLLEVLHSLHDKGIVHGNIRVTNLFDGGSKTLENVMLGETLSVPSGLVQPVLYETIQRSIANPLGKGVAEHADDIYALGVVVAALLRTHDPTEGLSDDEIINQKIEIGSFNFIAGKDRFPSAILEFLRGVLNDDPLLRWTFDDILVWADGRRVNAKQGAGIIALKANRPLEFNKKKFLRPQALSIELPRDVVSAVPLVENGEMFLWLNRSLQDKEMEKRFEDAVQEAKKSAGSSNYSDRLACDVAISLSPGYPVFYRNLKFLPTGFGDMLVDAVCNKKEIAPFIDIIQSSIVSFWSKCYHVHADGVGDAVNRIGNCQRFINQALIGYGLERCIYYLSPMAPCLSEKLEGYYVRSAEDYLRAMESLATSKNRPDWFLDRHIVSFLLVRDKTVIEPFLADIAASERYRQRLGVLKVFASIQRRDKVGALPGLSAWISGLMDILIDRYHDRDKRKRVKSQLEKIADKGDLSKIAELFDNFEELQMDMKTYAVSMQQYQMLKEEYINLEYQLDNNKMFGIEAGRQTAAMVSGIIAAIVVLIYLIVAMTAGGGGARFF